VSEKFDLVRNWAVIGELMTLPLAIKVCLYRARLRLGGVREGMV